MIIAAAGFLGSTGLVVAIVSSAFAIIAFALWKLSGRKLKRMARVLSPSEQQSWATFQHQAKEILGKYPDLPHLPSHPFGYEQWFLEIFKRQRIRSEEKTIKALTQLYTEYRQFFEAWGELRRVGAKERVEDAKVKDDLDLAGMRTEVEKAKLEAELAKHRVEGAKANQALKDLSAKETKPTKSKDEIAQAKAAEMAQAFRQEVLAGVAKFYAAEGLKKAVHESKEYQSASTEAKQRVDDYLEGKFEEWRMADEQ